MLQQSASFSASTSLTPSPIMATVWPFFLQSLHQLLLLLRRHPAKDAVPFCPLPPGPPPAGGRTGRRTGPPRPARPPGQCGLPPPPLSPEITFTVTPLPPEVGQSLRRLGANAIGQDKKAQRRQRPGNPVLRQAIPASGKEEDTPPLAEQPRHFLTVPVKLLPQQHFRRPQHIDGAVRQYLAAPLPPGGEGHLPGHWSRRCRKVFRRCGKVFCLCRKPFPRPR